MNDKNQKAIKSCPQTNPIMIFFILTSLVGIISKSTHHPINKKPHEGGALAYILSLWVGVINGISICTAKTFDKPSFH